MMHNCQMQIANCLPNILLVIFFNSAVKVRALVNEAYYFKHKSGRKNAQTNARAAVIMVLSFSKSNNTGAHPYAHKNKRTGVGCFIFFKFQLGGEIGRAHV